MMRPLTLEQLNESKFSVTAANLMRVGSDDQARCEISDMAVNTLREKFGRDAGVLLNQEYARMRREGIKLDGSDLTKYLRVRRVGSKFRLSRNDRKMVYAQVVCRMAR